MTEWFEQWFGEDYLELYPHRDAAEAERVIAMLDRIGALGGPRVLDLACGAGRHLGMVAARGLAVTGVDLSLPLLREAREAAPGRLVRGDIRRLPLRGDTFDTVLNLFTSFGYFTHDAEHAVALAEVARVLRPGGRFVLDFLNAPEVRANLVARDERTIGERVVIQERRLSDDSRFVIKSIHLSGDDRVYMERVRLFDVHQLSRMLAAAGLAVAGTWGDYDAGPHTSTSPRCLVVARRA